MKIYICISRDRGNYQGKIRYPRKKEGGKIKWEEQMPK